MKLKEGKLKDWIDNIDKMLGGKQYFLGDKVGELKGESVTKETPLLVAILRWLHARVRLRHSVETGRRWSTGQASKAMRASAAHRELARRQRVHCYSPADAVLIWHVIRLELPPYSPLC